MDAAGALRVNVREYLLHHLIAELVHGLPQYGHEAKPINPAILVECFLEGLYFKLVKEYPIFLEGFIEILQRDDSGLG